MSSINGIGTTYYGKTDVRPDGSYITTEFLILLLVPICPLGSYRVWEINQTPRIFPLPGTTTKYHTEPIPLCWKQVLLVYFIFFISAFILIGGVIGFVYLNQYLAGETLDIF